MRSLNSCLLGSLLAGAVPWIALADLTEYRTNVLAEPSLVSLYTFEGGDAADAVSTNHGTLSGTTSFAAGISDASTALTLTGGGHVRLGHVTAFNFASGLGTVEAWVRADWSSIGYNPCLFSDRDGSPVRWSVHLNADKGAFGVWNGSSYSPAAIPGAGTSWHHVAVVFSNSTVRLYWDGRLVGTAAQALGSGNVPTELASSAASSTAEGWVGALDEVAFYSTALSGDRIAAHFNSIFGADPPAFTQPPQSLIAVDDTIVNFRVAAFPPIGVSLQWQRDGTNLPAATNATLTLPNVTAADSGAQFRVIAANLFGATTSAVATLTVTSAPPNMVHYRSAVQAEPSLVAYFPVEGTNGTTITNVVNPAFSGTLQGSATLDRNADRMVGRRAIGQSANGWTALTRDPAWEFPTGSGTIEVFLYQSATAGYNPAIFSCRNDSLGNHTYTRYSLHGAAAGGVLMLWNGGSLGSWSTPVNMIGRLVHVAYVFDNGTTTVYFNGESLGTRSVTMSTLTGLPFQIGSASPSTQEAWPGTLDELAIYGEALPAGAIAAHYQAWLSTGPGTAPVLTQEPRSVSANEGSSVGFTVELADASGATYRWLRNGAAIPGETNATLTVNTVSLDDDGAQFRCVVYNPFGGTHTAVATLTVFDANPPQIASLNTLESPTTLLVTFSEVVTTNGAAFALDGGASVLAVRYGLSSNILVLTTTPLTASARYALTVNGVLDLAGNVIATNSSASFVALTYVPLDAAFLRGGVEPMGPATRRGAMVIAEIMYHPTNRADGLNGEFIELYNSQPWAEDLTGFRLSGEVDFAFPSGTTLGAHSYLLVAPAPADVTAIYGATNVIGGFTNRLNNGGGPLRLHDYADGVIFEVNYDTSDPWPVAPDGTGHSLVLARPSQGMNNPRAWAASQFIGGSPGLPEPSESASPSPYRSILINEFFASSDPPALDFIELFNYSTQAVDLAGCTLSDEPAFNQFIIPPNTVVPPLGWVVFYESEHRFALSSSGEAIYLKDRDGRRVLDAVRFSGQQTGVSMGRSPDGAAICSRLQTRTPGTPNAPPRRAEVVINEIMYAPITGDGADEFLELHNRGAAAVDISGWRLNGGASFTLSPGIVIPAGGYLVIANNPARLLTNYAGLNSANLVGNLNGRLSNGGEHLLLLAPEITASTNASGQVLTNTLYFAVDEVTYGTGGRWGRWSDRGGSSLELVDARADNRLAPAWADSDETAKSGWKTIEFTGVLDNGVSTPDQLQILLQGPGECLVDDVEVIPPGGANRLANGNFESGTNGWFFQGTHGQSSVEDGVGFGGSKGLHIRASDRGDTGANRIRSTLTSALASGQTATLRAKVRWLKGCPEILFRLRGSWLEAYGNMLTTSALGTPGASNSRALTNDGPALFEVTHRPVLPADGQAVTVFARMSDPDGLAGAAARYRLDPSSRINTVSMVPHGAGWFSARIPAQAAGTLAAFHVVAQDALGATAAFPNDAPIRECLVRWGESPVSGSLGVYRFWMTRATQNQWEQREKNSNEPLDITFAYGEDRVVYNAGAEYSGSPFHTGGFTGPNGVNCDYTLTFPADDPMLGETWMMLAGPGTFGDDLTLIREQIIWWIARQISVPALHRRFVRVFVNGQPRQTVFEDTQQPNGDFLREWRPDDSDGDLFKGQDWIEFADNGASFLTDTRAVLGKFTTTGGVMPPKRYRWMWAPRSVEDSANDFTNLFTLVETFNLADPALYTEQTTALVDVENWSRAQAVQRIAGNWDSWGWTYGKNMYAYKPERGPWIMVPWDIDFCFGTDGLTGGNPASDTPTASLFSNTSNYDGGAPGDPLATKFRNNPEIQRAYWRAYQDAVNGPMDGSAVNARIDLIVSALQGEGLTPYSPAGVKSYISQRRAFILAQLATVNAAFAITSNSGNDFTTNRSPILLTGTAPVEVRTVRVNGAEYPITWTGVTTWSMRVPLVAGTNALVIQGHDLRGKPLAGALDSLTIAYTGADVWPVDQIVFNELMYDAPVPGATFVELFNTSTNATFDLSGWRLDGLGFTFPAGSVLTNRGLMVLAQNRGVFANTYGASIPVFAEFDRELDNGGETLSLVKPGATPAADVVVDRVRYDSEPPWPRGPAGQGSSLQLLDARQDNSRVSNWGDPTGWRMAWITGIMRTNTTNILISLNSAGDVFMDDVSLVAGSVAEWGPNLVQNGDFEAPLDAGWTFAGTGHSGSARSTAFARSGTGSLHVVATNTGGILNCLRQEITPPLSNSTYTLSFWFLPSTNGNLITVRGWTGTLTLSTSLRPAGGTSPGATNSLPALLPPYPPVWLNEVQSENVSGPTDRAGDRDPWIELFNAGNEPVSLAGFCLSDNYTNLTQWEFSSSAVILPGQFLVVWADGEPGESTETEYHTSFRLSGTNGAVALTRRTQGKQVLDYFNYRGVPPDRSYGAVPDGQPFFRQVLYYATPGGTNNGAPPPVAVFLNEWMAANTSATGISDPADGDFDDWFELYNPGPEAADLAGCYLTDNLTNPFQFRIPAGYALPPGGFLLVWADNETGQNRSDRLDLHASFRLAQDGEAIGLFAADGTPIDTVAFGPQSENVSEGRYPDGASFRSPMSVPTPRLPNVVSTPTPPPEVSAMQLSADGHSVSFAFSSVTGRQYQVLYTDDLSVPDWRPLGGIQVGTGAAIVVTDELGSNRQRFYRVWVLP